MSNYTSRLENAIWKQGISAEEDYSETISFLNSPEFRSFGLGLQAMLSKRVKIKSSSNSIQLLRERCLEKSISIDDIASNSTLRNWFSGKPRPDKSESSRKAMFLLAFALELTPEETAELFHHVYLDRAFDFRNPEEAIYYYCLKSGLGYKHAVNLISKIKLGSIATDNTVFTTVISAEIEKITEDDDLLRFININSHNFSLRNVSAKVKYDQLLVVSKEIVQREINQLSFSKDYLFGKDRNSVNFLYEVITGQPVTTRKGTTTIFRNNRLPKEIKNRFPQPITFSKQNPTYEELRKLIIFLSSYPIWFLMQFGNDERKPDFDTYVDEINDHLSDSGLSPLYPGNPYDWLYLYCATTEFPLDTFRGIIDQVESAE